MNTDYAGANVVDLIADAANCADRVDQRTLGVVGTVPPGDGRGLGRTRAGSYDPAYPGMLHVTTITVEHGDIVVSSSEEIIPLTAMTRAVRRSDTVFRVELKDGERFAILDRELSTALKVAHGTL